MWQENFEMARVGEELGFDSCVTAEHHFLPDAYNPSPLVSLTAIASKTSRIKVGTTILQLPFHHPLNVAQDAAMLDILSNGRLILGVGPSGVRAEFEAYGLNVKHQSSLIEEGIEVIRRAWTEDKFSFYGRHFKIRNLTVTPKPLQKPHPPIWYGAESAEGCKRAGRLGLPWVTAMMSSLETLKKWAEVYRATAQARGHKPEIILWRTVWACKTRKEVEGFEKRFLDYVREDRWYYFKSFPGRVWGGELEPWVAEVKSESDFTDERLKPELIIGTPEEVVEQIERYRKELNFNYLLLQSRLAKGPTLQETVEFLRLFAREVMPHFKET